MLKTREDKQPNLTTYQKYEDKNQQKKINNNNINNNNLKTAGKTNNFLEYAYQMPIQRFARNDFTFKLFLFYSSTLETASVSLGNPSYINRYCRK